MPSRHDLRGGKCPREDITQGEWDPVPEQQHPETDLSSGGLPPAQQGAANHPNRAYRVIQTDSWYIPRPGPGADPFILPAQVTVVINLRQVFVDQESGMSPDGFPSRSMDEGGVSGLYHRGNGPVGESALGSDTPSSSSSSSSSSESAESSALAMSNASIHTARIVSLRPFRLGRPGYEEPGEDRLPSPAALDRMDGRLEDFEDGMLTGDRIMGITVPDRGPATRGEGRLGPTHSPRPHIAQGNNPRPQRKDHTEGRRHQAGVNHGQPPRVSPTPSDSSIAETIFNVRRATPPRPGTTASPPPSDRSHLPSLSQHAAAVAGQPAGLMRGPSYPASTLGQEEEAVPPVLVPGGLLCLGGSHPYPPPQVRCRLGQGGSGEDVDEERRQREHHKK